MKKLSIVIILLTLIFSLASCGGGVDDINITYNKGESTSSSYVYNANISVKIKDIQDLEEIAYNVASQLYEENFESIGASSILLTINFSDTNTEGLYGSISFDINKTIEQPGLSLNSNDLVLS
ncbi:lipoprotein [Mariniplasma anaerobium]|uniref:Uncharacterized protein n=1 Tax=Mariniplasma anaerobium TaxID=2735436 RepID=A0A7U9XW80_9MOLU|nr:hypothetical protein [Mariniplasma anaerobium]BCR36446.1 hypothetical protein MPAN_013390 [Mariniplasma anaerobium]